MFDLFRRRDKFVRYVLTALLGLVALSMVITLIPGYGTPSAGSENIVAEVGGEPITMQEVRNTLQMAVRNGRIPSQALQFYAPQVIEQMIAERAVAYQAERMGFEVTDEELAQAIRSITYQFMPPGQFDRKVYERYLAEQGQSVEQFESYIRKNLLLLRLQNLALEGVIVPPAEVTREFHLRNDKVKLEYVLFSPAKYRDAVSVTREEALDHFNKNRASYQTPERRSYHLLIADESKMASQVSMSDADLQRLYQQNLDRYRSGERVKARHILIKTTEKPKEEIGRLEAKAGDILKQLRGGADFAELAKKHSEDPGSAAKGGDLDWVSRGQTVKAFEDAAFSLAPKQLSNLVKTENGYHIIQVLEKEQARVKPFEEVKVSLAKESQRRLVYEKMQQAIDQAREEVIRTPAQAEQIAAKHGLIYVKADNAAAGESVAEVGTSREVEGSVFSANANSSTDVFQLSPTRIGFAYVTDVQAPRQAEFAEVEAQVREQLITVKASRIADEKTKEATEKMRAAGNDLKAAAAAIGTDVKTTEYVTAEGSIPNVGSVATFGQLLSKPVGSTFGPVSAGGNVFMVRLVDKQIADESNLKAEQDKLLMTLKGRKAQERKELFEEGLIAQLVKDGKIKKYPENIRRLTNAYRG
jgi:peptidyl-prolyl cis-trans isomerase D